MWNSDLTIPMPATCTAWYLVNGDMDPAEARATALQEVDEHASGHAPLTTGSRVAPSAVAGSGRRVRHGADVTPGVSEAGRRRVDSARVTISAHAASGAPPSANPAARADAKC
jgi:hypothetical protein